MKSDVYFVKVDSSGIQERLAALRKLLTALNPFSSYSQQEIIPVKITIGDSPCVYHLAPELVKLVTSEIKKQGAKPFICDTCVIYQGQRQNAVDHLTLAQNKGFGYSRVGAPFIIADGLFGYDGKEFSIESTYIKKVKVPSFIGILESLVVLSHPTGHILAGYAGVIKNVAMGMSCRSAKQVQHSVLKPSVIADKCTACGCCIAMCPVKAIAFRGTNAFINERLCLGCAECICACKFDAIYINYKEDPHIFCRRIVDVAGLILPKFKNKFFINFAFDITKECDCISNKDEKMVAANIGILASRDPVSLDKATTDLAYKNKESDYLSKNKAIYESMLDYAFKKGLGNIEYNLIAT